MDKYIQETIQYFQDLAAAPVAKQIRYRGYLDNAKQSAAKFAEVANKFPVLQYLKNYELIELYGDIYILATEIKEGPEGAEYVKKIYGAIVGDYLSAHRYRNFEAAVLCALSIKCTGSEDTTPYLCKLLGIPEV